MQRVGAYHSVERSVRADGDRQQVPALVPHVPPPAPGPGIVDHRRGQVHGEHLVEPVGQYLTGQPVPWPTSSARPVPRARAVGRWKASHLRSSAPTSPRTGHTDPPGDRKTAGHGFHRTRWQRRWFHRSLFASWKPSLGRQADSGVDELVRRDIRRGQIGFELLALREECRGGDGDRPRHPTRGG